MNDQQYKEFTERLDNTLKIGIETHVNGKIRALTAKLEDYIAKDVEWKKEDMEWKESVNPTIDSMENVKNFGAVGTGILKAVILIGSAGTAVWAFFHFIAQQ